MTNHPHLTSDIAKVEIVDIPMPDEAAPPCEARNPMLWRLLKIADGYRAENDFHQAMAIYFEVAEKHPGTPEAFDAIERLLQIGNQYEEIGETHQAYGIYERLL